MHPLCFQGNFSVEIFGANLLYGTKIKPIKLCKASVTTEIVTTKFAPEHVGHKGNGGKHGLEVGIEVARSKLYF